MNGCVATAGEGDTEHRPRNAEAGPSPTGLAFPDAAVAQFVSALASSLKAIVAMCAMSGLRSGDPFTSRSQVQPHWRKRAVEEDAFTGSEPTDRVDWREPSPRGVLRD